MDDLYKPSSLMTLAGCITAVVVVMNTMRSAFHWGPNWAALLLALLVSVAAYYVTSHIGESKTEILGWPLRTLIVVLNGCLIYTSAYGVQNNVIAPKDDTKVQSLHGGPQKLTFRSAW